MMDDDHRQTADTDHRRHEDDRVRRRRVEL